MWDLLCTLVLRPRDRSTPPIGPAQFLHQGCSSEQYLLAIIFRFVYLHPLWVHLREDVEWRLARHTPQTPPTRSEVPEKLSSCHCTSLCTILSHITYYYVIIHIIVHHSAFAKILSHSWSWGSPVAEHVTICDWVICTLQRLSLASLSQISLVPDIFWDENKMRKWSTRITLF